MASEKSLEIFNPGNLLRSRGLSFDDVKAYRSPDGSAYAELHMAMPWPDHISEDNVRDYHEQFHKAAQVLKKAFDYSINGLRNEHEKFLIETPVSHGLGNRQESEIRIFVWEPEAVKGSVVPVKSYEPEEIKQFLKDNNQQINQRLRNYFFQQQSQAI